MYLMFSTFNGITYRITHNTIYYRERHGPEYIFSMEDETNRVMENRPQGFEDSLSYCKNVLINNTGVTGTFLDCHGNGSRLKHHTFR